MPAVSRITLVKVATPFVAVAGVVPSDARPLPGR